MIFSRNYVHTNSQRKELPEPGLELFNLTANDGDIHRYPAGCIPFHWHSELEVFVLLSGNVQISIGDCSFPAEVGEGCFINTGVLHSFYALEDAPCRYRSFVFDSGIVSGMPGSIFDMKYVRPLLNHGAPFLKFSEKEDPVCFKEFDAAFCACIGEPHGYEFRVRESLSNILLYISEKSPFDQRQAISVQERRLKRILEWADENIEKNIRINDLAAAANICPRECQRLFKKYLHCSPMEYLRRQRIFIAADFLSATDEPITNIALRCGFSSPSYFSNQFKRIVGKMPLEYRAASYGKK